MIPHRHAFPTALVVRASKLSASGQALGGSLLFEKRLGFSGTPNDLLPEELGEAAFAAGDRDAAADELLGMFEADREWNESAAKAKLLQIFEAVGLEDPWVVSTRRRLSRLLFG